jgi:hypothetical protein
MNNYINNLNQLMMMGQNPQQIIQNAIAQNPQLQQVFSQLGPNMSAKQMVMQIAQQRGINLNPIIAYMQQCGMKL